jgi:spore coat polysaccharide biosynthesis protein SpsF
LAELPSSIVVLSNEETKRLELNELTAQVGATVHFSDLGSPLDRVYRTAQQLHLHSFLLLRPSSPLIDPELIDGLIDFFIKGHFDYASNILRPTFPQGLDVEIISFKALEAAWTESTLPHERRDVTLFVRRRDERFRLGSFIQHQDSSHLPWNIETQEGRQLIENVVTTLRPRNPRFTIGDVMEHLALQK